MPRRKGRTPVAVTGTVDLAGHPEAEAPAAQELVMAQRLAPERAERALEQAPERAVVAGPDLAGEQGSAAGTRATEREQVPVVAGPDLAGEQG